MIKKIELTLDQAKQFNEILKELFDKSENFPLPNLPSSPLSPAPVAPIWIVPFWQKPHYDNCRKTPDFNPGSNHGDNPPYWYGDKITCSNNTMQINFSSNV